MPVTGVGAILTLSTFVLLSYHPVTKTNQMTQFQYATPEIQCNNCALCNFVILSPLFLRATVVVVL